MADFKGLKSSRESRTTAKSFVGPIKSNHQGDTNHAKDVRRSASPSHAANPTGPGKPAISNPGLNQPDVEMGETGSASDISSKEPTSDSQSTSKEGLYKSLPPSLEIRNSNTSGRGVYSKGVYRPGEVLLSLKPQITALSNAYLGDYCSNCANAGDGSLKRCTGCKVVSYCGSKCQTKDWALHKKECAALQRWMADAPSEELSMPPNPPNDAVRSLGRILWRQQRLGKSNAWSREIDAMQSHRASLSKDPNSHDSQVHTHLAHALVRYLGLSFPQELAEYGLNSAGDLVDLISRFTTNTFAITTPTLSPIGACVSPTIALFNHSCDPNAVIVFPHAQGFVQKENEPQMQVIALKYIQPGEEILTSYIDTTLPSSIRQKELKETYYFTCKCPLCLPSPTSPIDMREAMWCPKYCGSLVRVPIEEDSLVRCTKCGAVVNDLDSVLDAVRIGQEALEKAERVQFSDPEKAIQLSSKLIPILTSAHLLPSAHPLLALTRLNTSLLISKLSGDSSTNIEEVFSPQLQNETGPSSDPSKPSPKEAQEALNEAIRAASRSFTGLNEVLEFGHPVRGVALAELGKLLTVDEPAPKDVDNVDLNTGLMPSLLSLDYPPSGSTRLKMAHETLVRARSELVVGFGGGKNEGGEVGQAVRKQIVDIEKELGVWKSGIRNALESLPNQVQRQK